MPIKSKLSAPFLFLRENTTIVPSSTPKNTGAARWPNSPLNAGSGGPGPTTQQITLDLSQNPPANGVPIGPGSGILYVLSVHTDTDPGVPFADILTLSIDPATGRNPPLTITPTWSLNQYPFQQAFVTWVPTAAPTQTVIQVFSNPGTYEEVN